jgi:osmotically-inducible protein OsmY
MKEPHLIRRYFVGIVLVAIIASCAGTSNRESTGEYIDDSVLTTKVKAEIMDDPMLKVLQIEVDSFKGVVELDGTVDSEKISARAEKVANSLKGVRGVQNNLVVR